MSALPTRLYLIRHAQTEWNALRRYQGQMDIPLSAEGLKEVEALRKALQGWQFDVIYSSDLERAWETARAVGNATSLQPVPEPKLREITLGPHEGCTRDEFYQKHPELARRWHESGDSTYALPGGESREAFHGRVVRTLEELVARHPGKRICAVTHGGVIRQFMLEVFGLDQTRARQLTIYNTSRHEWICEADHWRLVSWGDISHLQQGLDAY